MLGVLTGAHASVHWYQTIFPVFLPFIKATLGLNNIQVGSLATMREAVTGGLTLPAGFLADSFRRHSSLILAGALLSYGVAYLLVGLAPSYGWALPAVALAGAGSALYHPTAQGSLSLRFPEKRGTVLAIHGVGASIGDTLGPLTVGALLLAFSWRGVLGFHLLPALVLAFVLWKGLGRLYTQEGLRPSFRTYLTGIKGLIRQPVVIAVQASNVLATMGRLSILTFLPIYLKETLGYSSFRLGLFMTLLFVMGTWSQLVMGVVSDRFGRKAVLVPSFACMALLYLAIAFAGSGLPLALVIGTLGLFFYPIVNTIGVAIMDVAGKEVQSSTFGVTNLVSQPFAITSPILAGVLVTEFGLKAAFWYASIALALATLVLVPVRFPNITRSEQAHS